MAYIKGRGVRVEVAKTYGDAKNVTAITKADPAVASSAGHGLLEGSVGYLQDVGGMVQLEGQAARLGAVAAGTFELEEIDTQAYADFSGTAHFVPVTAWETVAPSTSYAIGGGEADKLDTTVLLDEIKQEENGLLSAQSVTFNVRAEDVPSAAMKILRKAAISQAFVVMRITLKGGAQRVFRGQPSLPGEDVQQGQVGTGSLTMTVKGQVLILGPVTP